jgi:hypothetical protein
MRDDDLPYAGGERAPRGAAETLDDAGAPRNSAEPLLRDEDLRDVERTYPEGLTSKQIVDLFESRGVRLSEATFRKYVQLGLLPRSRRVGRKGKHQGSCGIYPALTVRRINAIKRLMASSYTIEDIQRSFLRFQNEIESIESGIRDLFSGFEKELREPHFDRQRKRTIARELDDARRTAGDLVRRINSLERQIARPPAKPTIAVVASGRAGESW